MQCSRFDFSHALQTKKRHFLQQKKSLPSYMQKWHSLGCSNVPSSSSWRQQHVFRGIGLHQKQQNLISSSQQLQANFTIFSSRQMQHSAMWSSGPLIYIRAWLFSHLSRTGLSLSVVTFMQYSQHFPQSLIKHFWSQKYSLCLLPHFMHPCKFYFKRKASWLDKLVRAMVWPRAQVWSEWMSISLQSTQQPNSQFVQYFGHYFTLLQSSQAEGEWTLFLQMRVWPQEQRVLMLAMMDLGLDWSNLSGSYEQQASQMPKLQWLSSQTPSLLTAVLMPQISQMQLMLAMRWKLQLWPMGQPSLEQGGTLQETQQNFWQILQQDLQSFCSLHWAHIEEIISQQDPMKNQSWCPLRHLYYFWSIFRCTSSGETYSHLRQCSLKALRVLMECLHSDGLQGQKKSISMSGMGSTQKGALHLLGHLSRTCLESETHFMQQMRPQGPLHRVGLIQTSKHMPHQYFYLIYLVLRNDLGVQSPFSIVLK